MAVRIGLVGTGTVGGGCIDIIQKHRDDFRHHYGIDIELARVCSRNPEQAAAHGVEGLFTGDFRDIVNDPDIDLVIELIGGTTTAREVVLESLAAGKAVVTANKALMATHGKEVMDAAEAAGRELAFEASVGGGIPIIDPLKHSLIANEVLSVMGIVNGTTNYMLTRMAEDNMSYDEALAEAQEAGFAEANPSADVDGFDAAAKIAILASIAFNSRVTMDDVYTRGITNITPVDLEAAADMGYAVKLLAIAHRTPGGIDVRVHPTMEVARHLSQGVPPLVGCTCTDELPILPIEELSMKYYIRFSVADRLGVLATMAEVFARHNVSVHSMVQRGKGETGAVDVIYVTHQAKERDVRAAIDEIKAEDDLLYAEPSLIRVEE